tara:strand:+ start:299 stop:1126 length:828 start_codon:yes stop_codon:yes gene_type:complete
VIEMEQRAPRTAAFATTVATMSLIGLLGNAFLGKYPGHAGERVLLVPLFNGFLSGSEQNFWASTGWSLQEWIWLSLTVCLGLLAVWGRTERQVPELPSNRSVAEQLADFESRETVVGVRQSASSAQATSSIISSILGESTSVDVKQVESAQALLSSGELGRNTATTVSDRNTTIESRTFESDVHPQSEEEVVQENRDFVTNGPSHVPLPDAINAETPMQQSVEAFVSDGPAHVPLPELPQLGDDGPSDVPDMLDLDDLFEADERVPDMPDLDDLF